MGELSPRDALPGPGYTPEQARAHKSLTDAIQDQVSEGVLTPCQMDPGTWDADDTANGEEFEIRRAGWLCRTACPVFELCAAFVATNPPLHGVVAGQFRRHPLDPRHGRTYRRDVKAEWAAGIGDGKGRAA
ncbi:hypothetical protein [Microlunatus sp. GCM10028923]|uniref:hypothetical protein n=1 Tax=Microlunatus sp. GCM10028923 TaxID=3273400 RepID=UPI003609F0BC